MRNLLNKGVPVLYVHLLNIIQLIVGAHLLKTGGADLPVVDNNAHLLNNTSLIARCTSIQ